LIKDGILFSSSILTFKILMTAEMNILMAHYFCQFEFSLSNNHNSSLVLSPCFGPSKIMRWTLKTFFTSYIVFPVYCICSTFASSHCQSLAFYIHHQMAVFKIVMIDQMNTLMTHDFQHSTFSLSAN
jgi:hypothetical protein